MYHDSDRLARQGMPIAALVRRIEHDQDGSPARDTSLCKCQPSVHRSPTQTVRCPWRRFAVSRSARLHRCRARLHVNSRAASALVADSSLLVASSRRIRASMMNMRWPASAISAASDPPATGRSNEATPRIRRVPRAAVLPSRAEQGCTPAWPERFSRDLLHRVGQLSRVTCRCRRRRRPT